jgi:hypothetical protein
MACFGLNSLAVFIKIVCNGKCPSNERENYYSSTLKMEAAASYKT